MFRFAVSLCFALATLLAANSVQAAVFTVTKTADTNDGTCDADCSLREAIAAGNAAPTNDLIVFALPLFSSPQTITLSGSELTIANNGPMSIFGPGANRLTISGNNASRILVSGANVTVDVFGIRFTGGNGVGAVNSGRGGAVYNVGGTMRLVECILTGNSAANGGALNNAASASPSVPATLLLDRVIISNNSSTSSGAAMQNFSTSFFTITNSTVANNTTTATGIAGAFQANGTVTISNTTFSGNSAPGGTGGGVYFNGTSLIMTNSTLAGNSSGLGGGGLHRTGTNPTANVRNSIISDNTGAAGTLDVSGAITSQGNNIIESVGSSTGWVMTDQQNVDPALAPLGFYGGFGMTHYPLAASPAINAGSNCVIDVSCSAANPPVPLIWDQRRADRLSGANVDIGAVEANGNYSARLPSGLAGFPYTFTLVPSNGGFTYSVNSGNLGGIVLNSTSSTTLGGTTPAAGVFNALIHMTGGPGQAFQNYHVNVFNTPNRYSLSGRLLSKAGEPVGRAYVTFDGLNVPDSTTISNPFGYYRFDGLPGGAVGIVIVSSKKGDNFLTEVISVYDVTEGIDLLPLP